MTPATAWKAHTRLQSRWLAMLLGLATCVVLSGCATLPGWLPWHLSPKPAAAARAAGGSAEPQSAERRPKLRHTARRPEPPAEAPVEVASIDPNTLVGLRPPAVSKLMGSPAKTAKDEMSLVWTYATEGCALAIYFYPDLKTTNFHVLKYSFSDADGKPLAPADPCARKLLTARSNDAS